MESLERRLVASVLKDRQAAEKILEYLDKSILTSYSAVLLEIAEDFYKRDKERKFVDLSHVNDCLELKLDGESKRELYVQYAKECAGIDISPINVAELLLETKRKESAAELAQALANSDPGDASLIEKIDKHKKLLESSDSGEDRDDIEILHNVSVSEINEKVLDDKNKIKLLSKEFTDAIGGGALPGHHILLLARPETGKTAAALTCVSSLSRQKKKVLYFGNEDPVRSIVERFQGNLSRLARVDRLRDPKAADAILRDRGYGLVRFVALAPGSVDEIRRQCDQFEPDAIIVDQLRNLRCRAENRTNQLEIITTDLRNTCIQNHLLGISITQAGDSASGKLVLEMGDIDSSNTGIPAQVDVIVGLGLNEEFYKNQQLMISLSKNKLGGRHLHFPMKINRELSLLEDIVL